MPGFDFSSGLTEVLDYSTYTGGNISVSSSANSDANSVTLITGGTFIVNGSTPVMVEFFCPKYAIASTVAIVVNLYDNGSLVQWLCELSAAGVAVGTCFLRARFTPSAGSHQYAVKAWMAAGSTTATFTGSTGGGSNYGAIYLRVSREI